MKRIILAVILLLLLTVGILLVGRPRPAEVQAAQEDLTVESMTLASNRTGYEYLIDVALPESYTENPDKTYPVIYMTDGNWRKSDYRKIHMLIRQGGLREAIAVGIGYPPGRDATEDRVRDFNEQPDDFLDFILNQAIPAVDQKYRTDKTDRTLYGSSLGGYFSLYAFVKCEAGLSDAFKNYVAVSWCCMTKEQERALYQAEKMLKSRNPEFEASLFITVGGAEMKSLLDCYEKMVRTLESRRYPGLDLINSVYEGMTHETNGEPSLIAAVKKYLAEP